MTASQISLIRQINSCKFTDNSTCVNLKLQMLNCCNFIRFDEYYTKLSVRTNRRYGHDKPYHRCDRRAASAQARKLRHPRVIWKTNETSKQNKQTKKQPRILKKQIRTKAATTTKTKIDCLQSPIFPWDFRDSYAWIIRPPSWFVTSSFIKACEHRKSHGKIGDCEQSKTKIATIINK